MSSEATYLGTKGYTIYKECLESQDNRFIRDSLTVRPHIPKSPIQPPAFPVYRENASKIYVPKYFGIEHFGAPEGYRIGDGDNISVNFVGSLRDYQVNIVNAYMNTTVHSYGGGGLLDIPCGFGKCHGRDTKIMMYDGSVKMVQDINIGDQLMGDDSKPRNVLSLARGREKLYKVTPKKGNSYIVNESHILSLKCSSEYSKTQKKDTVVDISVKEWLTLPESYRGRGGVLYGYRVPVSFNHKDVTLDPYILGLWLGDGNSRTTSITTANAEARIMKIRRHDMNNIECALSTDIGKSNSMFSLLRDMNLITNKHIPSQYKYNSRGIQLQVLAGLIDADGHLREKGYDIIQKDEQLLDDIIFIARSLGFAAYKQECRKSCLYKTNIHGHGIEDIPVKVKRKISCEAWQQCKDVLRTRIVVTPHEEEGDYYGFTLDGNHRYLLGDFQVTHNTAMALNIISRLSRKTLVIVHKGFLLNQWVERIAEFLPSARVGTIQGQVIDIKDKDIVIGMLQSLSMKEYPDDMFSSFGLTVVDECHHISSEVFSRSLSKIVTRYTLGLSATMDRKDGLTHVFKMFLGDVAFKMERDTEDNVFVKCIKYVSKDPDFEEVVLDYRGNPQYSSMITKICDYNHRTEFILKVLVDELREKPDQQIMILGQNKSILKYIHDAIEHRMIATVGYYVGGMKDEALKSSEDKKVVVATYAMAAEGLDIKTLSTLFLVTPRTDITQAVGRILRVKHERPLVVDFCDTHDVFENQQNKRLAFYRKNNYIIRETDSIRYVKGDWDDVTKRRPSKKKPAPKCLVAF